MKEIDVRVTANVSNDSIDEEDGMLKVRVTAPATDGKANRAIIKNLSEYFNAKKNSIKIVRGEKSRDKRIRIEV